MSYQAHANEEVIMDTQTWQMLYGSVVIDISKMSATTIRLTLDVGDMRHLFKQKGQYVYITLKGCKRFAYRESLTTHLQTTDDETIANEKDALTLELTDIVDIAQRQPQLAHVSTVQNKRTSKKDAHELVIQCKYGELDMQYQSASIGVDDIKPISEQVLMSVSKKYWRPALSA